jgi:hypothetical protein
MKQILRRLKNKSGETLVESMAGILIFTFGSIIMLSMLTSAADINTAAKEADQVYFEDMKVIELAQDAFSSNVNVHFSIGNSSTPIAGNVKVDVYAGNGGLYAYYKATTSGEAGGGS